MGHDPTERLQATSRSLAVLNPYFVFLTQISLSVLQVVSLVLSQSRKRRVLGELCEPTVS